MSKQIQRVLEGCSSPEMKQRTSKPQRRRISEDLLCRWVVEKDSGAGITDQHTLLEFPQNGLQLRFFSLSLSGAGGQRLRHLTARLMQLPAEGADRFGKVSQQMGRRKL